MGIKNTINKIKALLSIFKIYKWSAILLLALMISANFSETLGIGMLLPLLEVITNPDNTDTTSIKVLYPILKYFSEYYKLFVIGILLAIFIVIKNALTILMNAWSIKFIYRYWELWSSGIMKKYVQAEYSYLLSQKQGTLINNIIIEPEKAAQSLKYFIEFLSKSIYCTFLFGLMLIVNWKITVFISIVTFFLFLILRKTTYQYSMNIGKKRVSLSQQFISVAAENISGVRQLKTFSVEKLKSNQFSSLLKRYLKMLARFKIIKGLPKPVAESIVIICIVGGLIYLYYVIQVPLQPMLPIIGLFIFISNKLFPKAAQLFSDRMYILNFVPSLKLMHEIYQTTLKKEDLEIGVKISHIEDNILFDHVDFYYNKSNDLFKGLNLKISKDKVTAIIGSSGEGKSTLVDLLFGLYQPQEGKILINNTDLKEMNLKAWRQLIGYVSQDVFLFNATIKENILIGKPNATEQEIEAAVKKANAKDFIEELPHGYQTVIGDRGLKLSGGQRQRIAIARVLIRDPELIIFDEATSAVDSETEQLIQECIKELSQSKTIIVISHRESTIQSADIVYTLENGKIFNNLDQNSQLLVS